MGIIIIYPLLQSKLSKKKKTELQLQRYPTNLRNNYKKLYAQILLNVFVIPTACDISYLQRDWMEAKMKLYLTWHSVPTIN